MIDPDFILEVVKEADIISYDTETNGLDARSVICGYVVATFDESAYAPVRHGGGANIPDAEGFEKALNEAFAIRDQRGLLTVGHNLAFDLKMSHRHGIRLNRNLEDTQINEGLIDDQTMSYGLDESAKRRGVKAKLGAELYVHLASLFGGMPDRKQMANFWKLAGDDPYGVDYACGDGITTIELWQAQQSIIDEYQLRQVHTLECKLIYHLAEMNRRGIRVDADYAARIENELKDSINEAKKLLPPGINVRSSKDLVAAYNKLGITDFAKTAGGQSSFTQQWLETNEFGRAVLAVRQLEKAGSSFIAPLVDTHNVAGRVHPTLNQSKGDENGAIGGRLSCSDPNMQAFPKRNKVIGKVVRPLIIPDYGDIYEMDFMQQEPHLFAHYSEDENLVKGYLSEPPVDIHDLACEITGRPRDDAKRLGMGLLTGLGTKSLADHMGWTYQEAKAGANDYFRAFPGIRLFQQEAKAKALSHGYVRTILGRIANIPDKRFAYRAVSRIIQGSGADHMKLMLLHACEYAESEADLDILISIHDSIVFQAEPNKKRIKELVRIVENCQVPPLNLIVPIPVELSHGKNWGESSYGNKVRNPKKGGWVGEWKEAA